ncbi:MAG: site-specific DNA-methyltransferase, partial [Ignavibacteriales bacterium]|nr:site-specific DNA-methyltransferase [Ignavibacteriales bacterium]
MIRDVELLTIKEASEWASKYLKREVTPSNISYLVQYGRVKKIGLNGGTQVHKQDLIKYYKSQDGTKETEWKKRLGHDLNWSLSFDEYKEFERTKHVHRLHPYKGKFIPQLVEYFLDDHTDDFKKQVYFKKGDIVLDPFSGSGTTMVQANELGMHAIGIDVSAFNALIANVKIWKHDLPDIVNETKQISTSLKRFLSNSKVVEFEDRLIEELSKFNDEYFPSPQYRYDVVRNKVDEESYGAEKERKFLPIFEKLVKEYHIELLQ